MKNIKFPSNIYRLRLTSQLLITNNSLDNIYIKVHNHMVIQSVVMASTSPAAVTNTTNE